MTHEPETDAKAVLRRYVAAVEAGDEAALRASFADDATWTLAAGTCRSPGRGGAATRSSASSSPARWPATSRARWAWRSPAWSARATRSSC